MTSEEFAEFKEMFEGAWILDQSYLSNKRVIYAGICSCGETGSLVLIKKDGSFWICDACVYGAKEGTLHCG